MKSKDVVLIIILALILSAVTIISSALLVTFDIGFYKNEFYRNGIYENFGDRNYVDNVSTNLIGYLRGNNNLVYTYYSGREISHLKDVRNLIYGLEIFLIIILIVLMVLLILLFYKNYKYLWIVFIGGFGFLILFILLFYLLSLMNFSYIFDKFHRLFFTGNSWILDSSSTLIRLFPEEFFTHAFIRILIISLVIGLFEILIGLLIKKNNLNKKLF